MEGAPKVWTLTPKIICQKFTFLHVLQKIAVESNLQMKFPACEGSRAEESAWTQTKELLYLTPIVTHGRSGKIQGENRNASFSAHTGPALSSSVSNTSQFSSVHSVVPNSLYPMDCSTPGFPVHHQLPEFTQTHVYQVGDAIQSSHPLLPPSPPAFNLSQNQGLFQGVSSSHQVAKILELQL